VVRGSDRALRRCRHCACVLLTLILAVVVVFVTFAIWSIVRFALASGLAFFHRLGGAFIAAISRRASSSPSA
jgi:uncharacterized membrane protein